MRTKVLLVFIVALLAGLQPAMASTSLKIAAVSSRPDTVSGGNVLIKISYPANQLLPLWVTLNGNDTTGVFRPGPEPNTWMGLVSGFNSVAMCCGCAEEPCGRSKPATYELPDHRPIFSGPHEQPFFCMTQNFPMPGNSAARLGPPLDADCSAATRVDYVYRATNNTFKALPAGPSYPADLAQTTTSQGKTVAYLVRVETGTIDRAIYQTAILHDPTTGGRTDILAPPTAWNHRLVYTLGGGAWVGGISKAPASVTEAFSRRPAAAAGIRCRIVDAERLRQQLPGSVGGREPDDGEGALHQELRSTCIYDRIRMLWRIGSRPSDQR